MHANATPGAAGLGTQENISSQGVIGFGRGLCTRDSLAHSPRDTTQSRLRASAMVCRAGERSLGQEGA